MVGLRVTHQLVDAHPLRQIALLGDISDAAEHADRIAYRIEAEDANRSRVRSQQSENMLDERRFPGAVGAYEAVDLANAGAKRHVIESFLCAERSREFINIDNVLFC